MIETIDIFFILPKRLAEKVWESGGEWAKVAIKEEMKERERERKIEQNYL